MITIGIMGKEGIGIKGEFMKDMTNRCNELMKKVENKQKLTYNEFIEIISYGLEMQFYYKKRKFGITHFAGYEFYEWEKEEGYQNYDTIEDFSNKINIEGLLVKDIWDNVSRVNFAD